jgi:hypothetical protein
MMPEIRQYTIILTGSGKDIKLKISEVCGFAQYAHLAAFLRGQYIIDIAHRAHVIEIVHQEEVRRYVTEQLTPLIAYTSGMGNRTHTLTKHVQRLFGHIPNLAMPTGCNTIEPKYLMYSVSDTTSG